MNIRKCNFYFSKISIVITMLTLNVYYYQILFGKIVWHIFFFCYKNYNDNIKPLLIRLPKLNELVKLLRKQHICHFYLEKRIKTH